MEYLPVETVENIWRNLSVEDLLNLCETNVRYSQICSDPRTWKFLIQRDYGIIYNGFDPKAYYLSKYVRDYTEAMVLNQIRNKFLYILTTLSGDVLISIITHSEDKFFDHIAEQFNKNAIDHVKLYDILKDYQNKYHLPTVLTGVHVGSLIHNTEFIEYYRRNVEIV